LKGRAVFGILENTQGFMHSWFIRLCQLADGGEGITFTLLYLYLGV
jgi:hypothetical protein